MGRRTNSHVSCRVNVRQRVIIFARDGLQYSVVCNLYHPMMVANGAIALELRYNRGDRRPVRSQHQGKFLLGHRKRLGPDAVIDGHEETRGSLL